MHDPRPVSFLLILQVLVLAALVLWWVTLEPPERQRLLHQVWWQEQVGLPPPQDAVQQVRWLWEHRLVQAQGMGMLALVVLVIGLAEGLTLRQRDVLGGFRLTWWTLGLMLTILLPGALVGYCLVPFPLPMQVVALVFAGIIGVIGFGMAMGRPVLT